VPARGDERSTPEPREVPATGALRLPGKLPGPAGPEHPGYSRRAAGGQTCSGARRPARAGDDLHAVAGEQRDLIGPVGVQHELAVAVEHAGTDRRGSRPARGANHVADARNGVGSAM